MADSLDMAAAWSERSTCSTWKEIANAPWRRYSISAAATGDENAEGPQSKLGAFGFKGCSAVSYFSDRVVSIIGAGRLSFRVRDGSGRFPAAVAAVTLFYFQPLGVFWWWGVVCLIVDRGCEVSRGVTRVVDYRKKGFSSIPVHPRVEGGGGCV